MKLLTWVGPLALLTLAATAAAAPPPPESPLVVHVREANARFKDVQAAVAEGYGPIPCTSGVDGGAMGVHYVNPKYLAEETPDVRHPQAVMYEPTADGHMELVGVEYISFKG